MARSNKQYICQSCGSVYPKWIGKCEQCNEWNTLLEEKNTKPSGILSKSYGQTISFEYLKNENDLHDTEKSKEIFLQILDLNLSSF